MFGNKGRTNNPEFEKKWKEYKETHSSLQTLEKSFEAHLETTKLYVDSCAALSLQIGSFFKSSEEAVCRRTTRYAQLNAQMEINCYKAIEKLYHEQILQPMQVLWVMDEEYRRAVKERKKLISIQNKRYKSWQNKIAEKQGVEKELVQEQQTGKVKRRAFGKRKSITEVNRELLEKQRSHQEAQEKQIELTTLTLQKLDSLAESRHNGELLGSAVSGILASQLQLADTTLQTMSKLRSKFKETDVFKRTLCKYEAMAAKGLELDQKLGTKQGFVFGRMLTSATPDIVCDCVTYIKNGIAAEGLFRIPGNRTNVEAIQASYDKNEKHILNIREDIDIHDVCSALKYYFNSLPEPLIPYSCYEELERFFDNENNRGVNSDSQRIIYIIKKIPEPYIGLLGFLLNFLKDVTRNQASNHMTSTNIATCFAPVLLKPRPDPKNKNSAIDGLKSMKNIAANIATVSVLIENAREFSVPQDKELAKHTNIEEKTIKRVNRAYMHNKKALKPEMPRRRPQPPSPEGFGSMPSAPAPNRRGMELNLSDVQQLSSQRQPEEKPSDVLQSDARKNRGFIRRVSLDKEDKMAARPMPPLLSGTPPGIVTNRNGPSPPTLEPQKRIMSVGDEYRSPTGSVVVKKDEIPAALLGSPRSKPTPPTTAPPGVDKQRVSIDDEL